MIEFLNNDIRERFHQLPIEKQRDWETLSDVYLHRGFQLRIDFIELTPEGALEISVRIDQKFNV